MTRRVKQSRPLLAPLMDNFLKRISSTDARLRRQIVKYGLWALALMVGYSFMSGTYGLPRIIRLELQKKALMESNRQLTSQLVDAIRTRKMLRYDRDFIEEIARTRYYMAYPGETIYRYRGR